MSCASRVQTHLLLHRSSPRPAHVLPLLHPRSLPPSSPDRCPCHGVSESGAPFLRRRGGSGEARRGASSPNRVVKCGERARRSREMRKGSRRDPGSQRDRTAKQGCWGHCGLRVWGLRESHTALGTRLPSAASGPLTLTLTLPHWAR